MTRVNLSAPEVGVNDEQAASLRVRAESLSGAAATTAPGLSRTGLMRETVSRMNSFALPLTIAVSLFAPNVESIRRRVRFGTSTALSAPYIFDVADETVWNVVLEQVTEQEIATLRHLWALPYAGPLDMDFRLTD